ncbi:MAG TPA: FliG C-terminal domain-containing protein [Kofleriaceae bacterium]|jgi:flagellar motor switch protein FliG|nr:FliG C-terminal domain-containing protein [Kofleriaceae bacterium]
MPGPVLDGPQKAAIALLSLDEEIATQVLSRMAEADVRKLVAAVEQLEEVGGDVIAGVLEDLERGITSPLAVVRTGGTKYVRKLANAAFGSDKAQKLFVTVTPPPTNPLELLRTARVNALAQLLTEEHPQIAAVVMTQLPASVAAKVLALMPRDTAADLTGRLSELEEVPEHAVTEASESLVRALEIAGGLATSDAREAFDGLAFSAAIVNEMSSEAGDELLGKVAERDETVASRIREALFTFEDLLRIAARELGNLMRSVQSEALVIALQTATSELRDHLLSALSQRAAQTLRDDLASASPRRLSEVEAAQREVVEQAMKLGAEGKLTMPGRGGE